MKHIPAAEAKADVTGAVRLHAYSVWEDRCLVWQGSKLPTGYGRMGLNGTVEYVHRIAWVNANGCEIPENYEIDHLCRNRACVNPHHLEAVTHAENNRRSDSPPAVNARMTHCKYGHELTPENTKIQTSGYRRCMTCHKVKSVEWAARYRRRKAEASA